MGRASEAMRSTHPEISDTTNHLQFGFERFTVKRLHYIFVRPCLNRGLNMGNAVSGAYRVFIGTYGTTTCNSRISFTAY